MINTVFACELVEQREIILPFIVDFKVGNAEIMKGRQQFVIKRILQGDSICYHVVEQAIYIVSIGSTWRCRHTKNEFWSEVLQDLSVPFSSGTMSLIDDDVVKAIRSEVVQVLRQSANHREQTRCIGFFAGASVQLVRIAISKYVLEADLRCRQDALPMGNEQHLSRLLPLNV